MITQNELFALLNYCPNRGVFTWLYKTSNRVKVGDVAGTKMINGYIGISVNGQRFYAHRLAWFYMTGDMPECEIDHINMDRADNKWANLRKATKKQNTENRTMVSNNTSGHMGVYWVKQCQKWSAKIVHHKKQIYLGYFEDKAAAVEARQIAEKALFTHAPNRDVFQPSRSVL